MRHEAVRIHCSTFSLVGGAEVCRLLNCLPMNIRGVDAKSASNNMSDALRSVIGATRRACTGHAPGGTSLDRDATLVYDFMYLVSRSGRSPAGSGLYEPASYRVRSCTYEPLGTLDLQHVCGPWWTRGMAPSKYFFGAAREYDTKKKRQENEVRGTEDGLRLGACEA
jgi:hypothetical protein